MNLKGYKGFITVFAILTIIYIVAQMNRPKEFDWRETLSKDDKNPFGTYILFRQLKDMFPRTVVSTHRLPVYNQVNNFSDSNTAYILIEPGIDLTEDDINEMLNYVVTGNYVFISAEVFGKALSDTLKFKVNQRGTASRKDSSKINFVNPTLKRPADYHFLPQSMDGYFEKLDTSHSTLLGIGKGKDANFIKIAYGDGAFFIHTAPLSFSNYFMLKGNNQEYTAKALSFLPKNVHHIYWDEYYKLGPEEDRRPLRFILSNPSLKWAFWIAFITMILYVFFEMKRTQRIIPIIAPLRNSTLDFVQTVSSVYFNKRDNKNIALKKISYFMEFLRSAFYLPTAHLNEEFIQSLSKKSGVHIAEITELVTLIQEINESYSVSDDILLQLNQKIDSFYAKAK